MHPVLLAALISAGGPSSDVWVEREAVLMGTRLMVRIEAPSEAAAGSIIDRVFARVAELESRWTTGTSGSELFALREAEPGSAVPLSDDTYELLATAWSWADRTDGAFEPTVGPLVDVWGAGDDGRVPDDVVVDRALASVGRRCFDLSPSSRAISRHCPDAWIDGGGLGKGAALGAIATVLEDAGVARARVDFGGQVLILGRGDDASMVDIADPRDRERPAFRWPDVAGSIATSAQDERTFAIDGDAYGRVIDPRSGAPVEPWGSVTVRSDDPVEADALATALLVMGPEDGIRWMAARPEVEAVLLVVSGGTIVACGRESLVRALAPMHAGATRSEFSHSAPH